MDAHLYFIDVFGALELGQRHELRFDVPAPTPAGIGEDRFTAPRVDPMREPDPANRTQDELRAEMGQLESQAGEGQANLGDTGPGPAPDVDAPAPPPPAPAPAPADEPPAEPAEEPKPDSQLTESRSEPRATQDVRKADINPFADDPDAPKFAKNPVEKIASGETTYDELPPLEQVAVAMQSTKLQGLRFNLGEKQDPANLPEGGQPVDWENGPGIDCSGAVSFGMELSENLAPGAREMFGTDRYQDAHDEGISTLVAERDWAWDPPYWPSDRTRYQDELNAFAEQLEPGMLVLMRGGGTGASETNPTHIGVYVGDGKVAHASSNGPQVQDIRADVIRAYEPNLEQIRAVSEQYRTSEQ